MTTADKLKVSLNLLHHPEGGWYCETYRASLQVSVPWSTQKRAAATSIYFLLEWPEFSAFHRIKSDELWHFYEGSSIEVYWFSHSGELTTLRLGRDAESGEVLQGVVPANVWFASKPVIPGSFALVGCTVSPGFDFNDFELASRSDLLRLYPNHKELITNLTHEPA